MPEKLWKAVERKLCQLLGGTRRGPTGRDESDCYHRWLSIEIKCNRKMPAYIREWMAQTWCNAEPGKLPIVVWHQVGDPYGHALVSMRLSSFLDFFGNGEEPLRGWFCPECGATTIDRFSKCAGCGSERLPFTDIPRPGEVVQGHG